MKPVNFPEANSATEFKIIGKNNAPCWTNIEPPNTETSFVMLQLSREEKIHLLFFNELWLGMKTVNEDLESINVSSINPFWTLPTTIAEVAPSIIDRKIQQFIDANIIPEDCVNETKLLLMNFSIFLFEQVGMIKSGSEIEPKGEII